MPVNPSRIRQFYEQNLLPELRQLIADGQFEKWQQDQLICLGYTQLGDLQYDYETESYNPSLKYVKIKPISTKIPPSVQESFNHHIIASQTRLADIYALRITVDEDNTYAILVSGYIDDGWDQDTELLEVYDSEGKIVGSCRYPLKTNHPIKWIDHIFTIHDYDFHYEEVQVWSEEDVEYMG